MLEYALLVALLALIAIAAVRGFGVEVRDSIDKSTNAVRAEGVIENPTPDE